MGAWKERVYDDYQEDELKRIGNILCIDEEYLDEIDGRYEIHEVTGNDDAIYDYCIEFSDEIPEEILEKIGYEANEWISLGIDFYEREEEPED